MIMICNSFKRKTHMFFFWFVLDYPAIVKSSIRTPHSDQIVTLLFVIAYKQYLNTGNRKWRTSINLPTNNQTWICAQDIILEKQHYAHKALLFYKCIEYIFFFSQIKRHMFCAYKIYLLVFTVTLVYIYGQTEHKTISVDEVTMKWQTTKTSQDNSTHDQWL